MPVLLDHHAPFGTVAWTAAGGAALGGAIALAGLRWPALLLLLTSGIAGAAADQLGVLQGEAREGRLPARVRLGSGAAALAGLGLGLAEGQGQWGWLALALFGLLSLVILHLADDLGRRLGGGAPAEWRARPEALPWALLPFALAGAWRAGLVALLVYVLVSLADAGRRLRALTPEKD